MRIAEFGVVVMLFLVGLEVQPKELWRLKVPVFGLGGLQVIVTAGLLMLSCMLLGVDWRGALAIGLALSLSSTAIVLQSYAERGIQQTEGGQNGFCGIIIPRHYGDYYSRSHPHACGGGSQQCICGR